MNRLALFFSLILFLFFSCDQREGESHLPTSSGKYGEVLVVLDTTYENGIVGNAIEKVFNQEMPGLPQQETQFRMSTVEPKSFKSILKRSRNLLKLDIKENAKTTIKIRRNVWAKDQLLVYILANSEEQAARILNNNRSTIRNHFNEEEINRLQKQYGIKPQKSLIEEIKKDHHIDLLIPTAYQKMDIDSNGFWLKKEKSVGEHQLIQGLSVYYYPYHSDSTFSIEEMILNRNNFAKKHIQGTRDSSFMIVYEEYRPQKKEVNLNDLYAVEYRGLWKMKNDFMGGPFLHYMLIDEANNRVVNLDGFVYAPKFNKREYIRELEAIMRSVELLEN